jgi:rare lipoprotein A (peptidoglycan hydrolase)
MRIHAAPVMFAAALIAAMTTGCARKSTVRVPPPAAASARIGATETGLASWYGVPYDGRRAASGEIYHMDRLTAAHRTLPFQTWVEVTDLDNHKRVNVRIIDRGPFIDGRIIDLSQAAAREIGMLGPGIARVRLKVIAPPRRIPENDVPENDATRSDVARRNAPGNGSPESGAPVSAGPVSAAPVSAAPGQDAPVTNAALVDAPMRDVADRDAANRTAGVAPFAEYAVQVGAFSDRERAESLQMFLADRFSDSRVIQGSPLWHVLVGHRMTLDAANKLAAKLRRSTGGAIVVRDR